MKKIILLLVFLLPTCAFAQENALSLFIKGNDAYKKQNYSESIAYYEDILKSGQSSGAVYYNLANAYYKAGELGKAVLQYKRAGRLLPRDSDIRFNTKYAEGFVQRSYSLKKNFWEKAIDRYTRFYTQDEMILIFTLSIFGLGLVFLLSRFLRWPKTWRYLSRGVFVVLFVLFGTGSFFKVEGEKNQAVMVQKSPAYFEPLATSTEHYQLFEGDTVKILKKENQWVKVRRRDGLLGWVPQAAVTKI